MSKKTPKPPSIDKRAGRTRKALAQAMIDLGGAMGFDRVTPGALAREAGVSRSTFYANFASKNDYMRRSFASMFQSCEIAQKESRPQDSGVLPSWHFFKHVFEAKGFAMSIAKSDGFPQFLAEREAIFRRHAAKNLSAILPDAANGAAEDLASMLAGAFTGLMRRWMETGMETPPEALHEAFEALVLRALSRP